MRGGTKLIYIAGPMRGHKKFNFPAFDAAAKKFRKLGFGVINPADLDRKHDKGKVTTDAQATKRSRVYARRDSQALLRCTHIAMLPGWQKSVGATAEYHFAKWIGLTLLDATTGGPLASDAEAIKNGNFIVRDSGERQRFASGAVRDCGDSKGFFHCIPYVAIERLAQLYEAGAKKYGKDNWRKGIPCSRYIDSLLRHALKLAEGWTDEDHAAAVLWNAAGYIWTEHETRAGRLPKELSDLPQHEAAYVAVG